MNKDKKCIVYGCKNHQSQGKFVGDICSPCHTMLTTGNVQYGTTFIHSINNDLTRIKDAAKQLNSVIKSVLV